MTVHNRQRGITLFIALVALVAMSLAAVALIRSVDTSTIIAGNLAFKQSATAGGDTGVEAAITQLTAVGAASSGQNVLNDPSHPFNLTCLATRAARAPGTNGVDDLGDPGCPAIIPGYHSNAGTVNLFDETTWNDINSVLVGTGANPTTGNTIRYVIERMCRNANQAVQTAECLFSSAVQDSNGQNIPLPQDICTGSGCPVAGQAPQIRITVRSRGPRNSVSYVQAFVY